ncbi:MAG: glycosyltransferase family 4 protein [Synoicihabitans sp.]
MPPHPHATSLYVITHEFYPNRGGIATFTEEIARASTALGWDTEVWAQHAQGASEKDWPFRIWRLPLKGTHDLSCQLRLAVHLIRRRRELRRATVYLPEPGPMLTLMLLQRFHAFRPRNLILTFHGSEILKFHRSAFLRPMARKLIHNAKRISVLTRYTRDLLQTHFPGAEGKVVFTPGALRTDFESQAPDAASAAPSHRKTIVLTVGRLHPRKGQLLTLQALSALPAEVRSNLEYWLVGSARRAAYEDELKSLAGACDFPVRFMGDLPDEELVGVYEQADVFAMTSINHRNSVEGFGLVYLEASAHGLPIVAHAVGGVAEAVRHNQTGLLVPPDKPEELQKAFVQLLDDAELRQRLGEAGRDWAQQNNWAQSAQVLLGDPTQPDT